MWTGFPQYTFSFAWDLVFATTLPATTSTKLKIRLLSISTFRRISIHAYIYVATNIDIYYTIYTIPDLLTTQSSGPNSLSLNLFLHTRCRRSSCRSARARNTQLRTLERRMLRLIFLQHASISSTALQQCVIRICNVKSPDALRHRSRRYSLALYVSRRHFKPDDVLSLDGLGIQAWDLNMFNSIFVFACSLVCAGLHR